MVAKKILATLLVVILFLCSISLVGCQKTFTQEDMNAKIAEAKSTAVSEVKGPLENQISELNKQISEKDAKIASLEQDKSTSVAVNNTVELESLKAEKATLETKVADLQKQLDDKSGKVVIELSNADLENGALIKSTGDDLNLGDSISVVLDKITKKELPSILADGTIVSDESNDVFDYEQYIKFDSGVVGFDRKSDLGDEKNPTVYLDTSSSTGVYDIVVEFSDAVDFTKLAGSETIKIAGKEYTVKPNQASGKLVLLGTENTVMLELGESKTISGVTYTLLGANSNGGTNGNAVLKVGSSQKTVKEGTSYVIGGQEVYIKSLYITDIPTTSASIEIFVGSQEMEIKEGASLDTLRINDETVKGVQAMVDSVTDATEIVFRVTPVDTNNDADKYIEVGSKFVDPVFGLKLDFMGMSEDLKADSKAKISLEKSGDVVSLNFVNYNENEYNLDVYETNGTTINYAENLVLSGSTLTEDNIFIVSDSTGKISYIYQVVDFDNEDTKNTSTIKDLSTDKEYVVKVGDNVGESNVKVNSINPTTKTIIISSPVLNVLKTENGGTITIASTTSMTFKEGSNAKDEVIADATTTVTIGLDSDEIIVSDVSNDLSSVIYDKSGDVGYLLSKFGTYAEFDKEDGSYLNIYYPKDSETKYYVSVSTDSSNVVKQTKEYKIGDILSGFGTIKSIN